MQFKRQMNQNENRDKVDCIKEMATRMRFAALDMALSAGEKGSHVGGSMSCIEIFAVLYGAILRYDVKNPYWSDRDRFIASKNHCTLAQLPALAEAGYFSKDELLTFAEDGSRLVGYPRNIELGLEYSGGSLGMAISVGVGMALAAKEQKRSSQIYILMGDGELNEGSIWEAFMSAAHYHLDNLNVIIDRNHLSYDGDTEEIMGLESLSDKMKAFNFHVTSCNGHDVAELLKAFDDRKMGKPHIIIAETVKGKGLPFAEHQRQWHHSRLSKEQYDEAKKVLLGGATHD